jgi:multidrug efflux pump
MAPARATAWIRPHKHGETREALPRFGIMALFAALALWLLGTYGLDFLSSEAAAQIHNWQTENLEVWAFRAGAIAIGAVVGFLMTRPINLVLGWFFGLFNKFFDAMTTGYTRVVGGMLRISIIVLIIYGGLLFLTYKSFTTAPTGFIPEQDQGYLITQVELPESSSVQRTQVVVDEISKIALKTPGVRVVVGIAGFSAFYQCNSSSWGTVFIILDDFSKRQTPELQGTAIQQRLNREIYEKIIDAKVAVLGAPSVPGLGQSGGFQLQIEDELGLGLEALQEATETIVEKANQQPVLRRVFTSFTDDAPQLYLDIYREKAKELGVSLSDVFRTLTANYGSLYVNQFNLFGRIWQVNIQSEGKFRTAIDQFEYLKVRNASGDPVPLTSIVQVRPDTGPIFVMRYNDLNSSPIFGAAAPGFSSGQALSLMEQLCKDNLPNGMTYEWTNIAYQQVTAGNTGILVFGLSVLLVFLVLAALYESWSLPFAIILVVPMCLLASVVGLVFVAHLPVDIFSQIGFIVLIGLAAKNAILVVEFAKEKKKEGLPLREATLEACKVRLRPILMTALAFILGVYPLVIAHGAGWEMRHSLGTAVFAGMIGVTLFGIFLTPVFYYSITWLADRKKA